jgi:hypothetical protein
MPQDEMYASEYVPTPQNASGTSLSQMRPIGVTTTGCETGESL